MQMLRSRHSRRTEFVVGSRLIACTSKLHRSRGANLELRRFSTRH